MRQSQAAADQHVADSQWKSRRSFSFLAAIFLGAFTLFLDLWRLIGNQSSSELTYAFVLTFFQVIALWLRAWTYQRKAGEIARGEPLVAVGKILDLFRKAIDEILIWALLNICLLLINIGS
jgi:hypothetical protein